ncbi:DEAD-domain-containing protein [Ascodesmis nigricans]|uniref:RNA helicase n=1 Tax=Ascodesmis nigricans TaxID=341454 RepID=A0A4S2N486_9PEZI|nr:DEAD-domain-containing protein [Ascodesmis nigricans]
MPSKKKTSSVVRSPSSPPPSKSKSKHQLDDFVLTISDSDADIPDLDESESSADEAEPPTPSSPEPTSKRGKKRKRTEQEQKQKQANGKEGDNGGLDSDFEFQTGDLGDTVGEFEGWGFEGAKSAMKDSTAAVDIDEIIRRRKAKKADEAGESEEEDDEAGDGDADTEDSDDEDKANGGAADSDEEDGEEDVSFNGFADDDEDVAADGFGGGAASDEEDSEAEPSRGHDDDSDSAGSAAEDSDAESVASAVPHPDDEASESDHEDAAEAAKRAAFFAPESETTAFDPSLSFQTMNLSRPIMRGLSKVGFTTPTPIQAKTIPVALLGKDIVGGAQTGSGKTGAFVVPILERLLYRPKKVPTSRVLILCPTRELAMQAHSVAVKLAAFTDIKFALTVGGLSLKVQEQELKQRPDVIIATPGRFIDHMRNSSGFGVDTIEILVMDEADRMLEDGFADELNEIINTLPKSRQTMLFSATMTDSVDKLVRLSLNRPVRLMVDAKKSTVATLTQEFVRIRPNREKQRLAMLLHICKDLVHGRCIIFFRSKAYAHKVRIMFSLFGLKAAELHGSLTQEQRVQAVESFRLSQVDFLLCTDLASRGLDIKNVSVVINNELPQTHEIYLHRVGRTARAGRSGRSITLATEADRKLVKSAVKSAQSQGGKVVSRVLDNDKVDAIDDKIRGLEDEVEEILKEEKEEKEIRQMEMQIKRTENIRDHQAEIAARPRRTWFETQKEKDAGKERGRIELNGGEVRIGRISGKKRKREEAKQEAKEGGVYKKTKKDRMDVKLAAGKRGAGGKGVGKRKTMGGKRKGKGRR